MIKFDRKEDTIVKLYELWLARSIKEGDWIYERKKIYLGLITLCATGVGAVFLFVLTLDPPSTFRIGLAVIGGALLSILGFAISRQMQEVDRDGREWQRFFTLKLAQLENEIFDRGECGLANSIDRVDRFVVKHDCDWDTFVQMGGVPTKSEAPEPWSPSRKDVADWMSDLPFTFRHIWVLVALSFVSTGLVILWDFVRQLN